MQVIIDADEAGHRPRVRPIPGNTADAKAWPDSGLAQHCEGVTVLGDGAYRGGRQRRAPRVPARFEHAFARMKYYKILRDCRQRPRTPHVVQAVARAA
ncbi:hypothetical protein [Streptomyces sp. NPDC053431]|uniref:hypothetical protein n=1 Tax=Streptomyces sp. NPDC053431 TaxID=3365703 RepID=UPI0037CF1603